MKKTLVVALALALVGVASLTSWAVTRGGTTVVQGCVARGTGELYKVSTRARKPTCKDGDKVLAWNQQGVPGATGPKGPTGATGSTGPEGPSGTTGQSGSSAFGSGQLAVANNAAEAQVPGLTQTVTVPSDASVYVASHGGIQNTATGATDFSSTDVYLLVDGSPPSNGFYARVVCVNNASATQTVCRWSLGGVLDLSAGSHTIAVVASGTGAGSTANVSGNSSSANQGDLSVLVLTH